MYKKAAKPSTCGKTEQRYCTSDQEDLGGSRGYIISPLKETAWPCKIGGRVWPGLVCHRAPASRVSRRLLHRARMSFSLSSLRGHPCMLPGAGVAPFGGIRYRQRLAIADSRQTEDGGALEGGEARRRRSQTGLRCAQRSDIGLGCAQNFPFPLGCVSAQSTTLPRLMGGQAECGHVCSADSCLTTEPPARSSQVPRHPQCPQAVALMLTRSRPRHAFNVAAHSSWATLALRRPNGRVSGTARRSRA